MVVDNKKIVSNTIALYIRMIVVMAINFYMSRVVLDVLGVIDYGIYNLVATIVVVFSFLKSSFSDATQRFINYTIGNGKHTQLSKIFSTCLNCYFILIITVIVLGEIFWMFWGASLNIPQSRYEAASFTYQIALVSFSLSILQVPYNAAIVAHERMGVFAKISIVEVLLKLFLTIVITNIAFDKLKMYSVLMMFNSAVIFTIYFVYCRTHFDYTKYIFCFDKSLFKRILSFTGWNMLGSLSGTLSESGVSLIFNVFCGVILNASIGLSNQINGALSGFIAGFQTAFKPQIVKTYAAKQRQDFHRLVCRSSKFSFFLFFLVSVPVICNMDYILHVWLVEVPQYACTFSRIILLGSLIDAMSGVFYSAIGATGKIRNYQVAITSVFVLHIVVTWVLLDLGVAYEYVFLSRIFTRGILNFLVGLYFLRKVANLQYSEYLSRTFVPIVKGSLIPFLIVILLVCLFDSGSVGKVVLNTLFFEIASVVFIVRYGLSPNERDRILSVIKNKIKK